VSTRVSPSDRSSCCGGALTRHDNGARNVVLAFTYDRYGHLSPEVDRAAAAKLDAVRTHGLGWPMGALDSGSDC